MLPRRSLSVKQRRAVGARQNSIKAKYSNKRQKPEEVLPTLGGAVVVLDMDGNEKVLAECHCGETINHDWPGKSLGWGHPDKKGEQRFIGTIPMDSLRALCQDMTGRRNKTSMTLWLVENHPQWLESAYLIEMGRKSDEIRRNRDTARNDA